MKFLFLPIALWAISLSTNAATNRDFEIREPLRVYTTAKSLEGVVDQSCPGSTVKLMRQNGGSHVLELQIWKSNELYVERYFFRAGLLERVRYLTSSYFYD